MSNFIRNLFLSLCCLSVSSLGATPSKISAAKDDKKVSSLLTNEEENDARAFLKKYAKFSATGFGPAKQLGDFSVYERKLLVQLPAPKTEILSEAPDIPGSNNAIVFNLDGYKYDSSFDKYSESDVMEPGEPGYFLAYYKGAPMRLVNGDPIGYAIHLPLDHQMSPKPLKGIVVKVYGGGNFCGGAKGYACPVPNGAYTLEDKYLMSQGYGLAYLSLKDLLSLEDIGYQSYTSKEDFKSILASIATFVFNIATYPESIDSLLKVLKGKKRYLMGTSFGGMVVVRMAQQKVPPMVDGIIGINGVYNTSEPDYYWLDALRPKHVANTSIPILAIHNVDDSRVPAAESVIPLINAMTVGNKLHFLSVYFPREGMSISDPEDLGSHGHFLSEKKSVFDKTMRAIMRFLENPRDPLLSPQREKWVERGYYVTATYSDYSPHSLEGETPLDAYYAFLSAAILAYKDLSPADQKRFDRRDKADDDDLWETHFQPLFERTFLLSTFAKHHTREYFYREVFDKMFPGRRASDSYLLGKVGDMIGNAAKLIFPRFIEYLKTEYPMNVVQLNKIDIEKFSRSRVIRNWIMENREFFLPQMLRANPQIVSASILSSDLWQALDPATRKIEFGKDLKLDDRDLKRFDFYRKFNPQKPSIIERAQRLLHQKIARSRRLWEKP